MADPGSIQQTGDGILVANTGTVRGNLTVNSAAYAFRLEAFPFEDPAGPASSQPASLTVLLRAASRVVPFTGRTAELSQLQSWREAPGRLSVMLVFGPGGQGKTRLAGKCADDAAGAGWAVLQARHGGDPRPPMPLADSPQTDRAGVLVIVDYAERWPRLDLERLLQHHLLGRKGRTRILLLARPAGYWWKALANPLTKLGASASQLPLGPLAGPVAQRRAVFTAARNRFAEILGVGGASRLQPAGSLADDAYQLALTLHMAALVAVDAHRRKTPAPSDPGQLSAYLIRREYDHWQTMHDNRRISSSPPTMARLVALATLTQSLTHVDAVGLLVTVGLAGDRAGALTLLDDHTSCYPVADDPGRVLEPLRPDRLGEDFLGDLMPAHGHATTDGDPWLAGLPEQLVSGATGTPSSCGPAVLTVLIETARRWEHVRRYLGPLLLKEPQLALTAGGASLVTLAGYADLDLLKAIESVLPEKRHVELDSGIAQLTKRLTDYGLAQTTDDAKRARLHEEMADRFSNAGLYGDALSATYDAIVLRRRLARSDPAEHEPRLANSLGNLGIDLWNLGRSQDALGAMTEAAGILRRCAQAEPGVHEEELAAELSNLAGALLGLDRYADALAPAAEATAIFRQRAASDSRVMNELGASSRNLAIILGRLGRPADALHAAQEAVDNYRRLAQAQPETYEVELAESLQTLSNRLSRLRRHAEALIAAEQSVAINRRLAAASPAAHEQNLAITLHSLALGLWNTGQQERSLAASEEAARLQRDLTRDNPRAHERGLGVILNSYAGHLLEVSRPHDAQLVSEEAVEIWHRLTAEAPEASGSQLKRAAETRNRALSALEQDQAAP